MSIRSVSSMRLAGLLVLVLALVLLGGCASGEVDEADSEERAAPAQTLVGAGDIANGQNDDDEATAALIRNIPGTVFTLGDNAYESGSLEEYNSYYAPTWGTEKARTKPT